MAEQEAAPASDSARFLTPAELEAIRSVGEVREHGPGEILFRRGELGDCLFLVEAGEVTLDFGKESHGKVLRTGEVFGELAFIVGRHTRTATAQVAVASRFRVMDQDGMERLFSAEPRLLVRLLRRTCAYLLDSEGRLIADLRRRNRELRSTLDYLRRTREELTYQELVAHTDELTGLYNRRCFDAQVERFLDRSGGDGSGPGLVLLDLDNFKAVNDTFGHAAGDRVLREVGGILSSVARSIDLPCRFGGDEFAIVLGPATVPEGRRLAGEIRRRVAAMPFVGEGDPPVRVTASIGGALRNSEESAAELFQRADGFLYRAKAEGRNRVVWGEEGAVPAQEI